MIDQRDDNLSLNTTMFHKGSSIGSQTTHGTSNVLIYLHDFLHTARLLCESTKTEWIIKPRKKLKRSLPSKTKRQSRHCFSICQSVSGVKANAPTKERWFASQQQESHPAWSSTPLRLILTAIRSTKIKQKQPKRQRTLLETKMQACGRLGLGLRVLLEFLADLRSLQYWLHTNLERQKKKEKKNYCYSTNILELITISGFCS